MMTFQDYSITKPSQEWFESSCNLWTDQYNFLLSLSFNTEVDNLWYKEQIRINRLYDV